MILIFINGIVLGILIALGGVYIKNFIQEYMFLKYHNEPPSPEQVIELREAMIGHRDPNVYHNDENHIDAEQAMSYQ